MTNRMMVTELILNLSCEKKRRIIMTFEKVKETILESLNCNEEKVVPEARLMEDLEMDSLDGADLAMALEDVFSISIPDEEFETMKTVQDIVDYIDSHK